MYHSITFGDKNTWDDWHLIPTSRPLFTPPAVKTQLVDIPGADGALDLTESLTGRTLYKNRTGSMSFYVENGFKDWTVLYSEIMGYLHGKACRAVLEDDAAFYYEGRFAVNEWKSDRDRSTITIDYDVAPYKKSVLGTDEEWLWDPFNFETGIIRYYKNLPVNGVLDVEVLVDQMPASPMITASETGMTLEYGGKTHSLKKGVNILPDLMLESGEHILRFKGIGRITIKLEGGRL